MRCGKCDGGESVTVQLDVQPAILRFDVLQGYKLAPERWSESGDGAYLGWEKTIEENRPGFLFCC